MAKKDEITINSKVKDWTNEMVLEFLEQYKLEPVLWDPKYPKYKRKSYNMDAWRRIRDALSWQCSIEELKKKKESLMGYYRIHLSNSKKFKSDSSDSYTTNWFAFKTMHSFLSNNYDYWGPINTNDNSTEGEANSPNPRKIIATKPQNQVLEAKQKMDEAFKLLKESISRKNDDECDLYAKLLAKKLKRLEENNRIHIMHEIDNIIYRNEMELRKIKFSSEQNNIEGVKMEYPQIGSGYIIMTEAIPSTSSY